MIESIFLAVVVSAILVIFNQLIEYQKSRQHYQFHKNVKEPLRAKPESDVAK